jgi:hypothetical protein
MTTPAHCSAQSPLLAAVVLSAAAFAGPNVAGADTAAAGASGKTSMTTTCPTKIDAAAIKQAAESAQRDGLLERIAPLLPNRWPEPRSVTFYTYYEMPLPTGMAAYSVTGPVRQVTFETISEPPSVQHFKRPKSLGREEARYFRHRLPTQAALAIAEQALLEAILGCQTPEAALPKLEPYREWFSVHPVIAKDVRRRLPAFMKWLFSVWPDAEFPKP